MKKLTNVQKILKALKSGPKTQADLVRETKVKNVYQIISDLKKKKLVFMDTGKCVNLMKVPIAVDETTQGKRRATGGRTTQT
jgi:predicted transcriptional regulator